MEQSTLIHQWFEHLIKKDSRKASLWLILGLILLSCAMLYAKKTHKDSSGVFQIQMSQIDPQALDTNPIFDTEHYFDDRVALIQSIAAQHITTLLTQTTSQWRYFPEKLEQRTTEQGRADLIANLEHWGIKAKMEDPDIIRSLHVIFTNGVPLVVEPHYPESVTEEMIQDPERRQMLPVDKWTLMAEMEVRLGRTGSRKKGLKVRFNFDIASDGIVYTTNNTRIERMSLWEKAR